MDQDRGCPGAVVVQGLKNDYDNKYHRIVNTDHEIIVWLTILQSRRVDHIGCSAASLENLAISLKALIIIQWVSLKVPEGWKEGRLGSIEEAH